MVKSILEFDIDDISRKIQNLVDKDPLITSEVIVNPEAALIRHFNVYVPEELNIKVSPFLPKKKDPDTIYLKIVLPTGKKPDELSDQQMDIISGGGQQMDNVPDLMREYFNIPSLQSSPGQDAYKPPHTSGMPNVPGIYPNE